MGLLSVIMSMIGGSEIMLLFISLNILLLTIVALIDVVKHNFNENNKIVWVLIVLFLPILGAILYFTIGVKQRIK
jgi:hypothetical protein